MLNTTFEKSKPNPAIAIIIMEVLFILARVWSIKKKIDQSQCKNYKKHQWT